MSTPYQNQSAIERAAGPTVRPLQGLPANMRGSSWKMKPVFTGVVAGANTYAADKWQTLFNARPETNDAEMLVVNIGAVVDGTENPNGSLDSPDLVARVTWGIGGANFEAYIDVGRGTTFAVCASFLRVDVAYNVYVSPFGGPDLQTEYQISGSVGYGTYSNGASTTKRTVVVGNLGPNGGAPVAVPAYAQSFTVVATPQAGTPNLQIGLGSGPTASLFPRCSFTYTGLSNGSNLNEFTYPLFNNSGHMFITNNDGVNSCYVSVLFNLAI